MPETMTESPVTSNGEATAEPTEAIAAKPDPARATQEKIALAEIVELNRECSRLEGLKCDAEARAKTAKKRWEAAVEELQALIRKQDERLPLFDVPELEEPTSIDILTAHGLSGSLAEHLDDQGFHTIGDLADWTSRDNKLTAIAGIGTAKAEKIAQALEGFWAERADRHMESVDAEADATPSPTREE